jgi:hypothetical protein
MAGCASLLSGVLQNSEEAPVSAVYDRAFWPWWCMQKFGVVATPSPIPSVFKGWLRDQ